MTPFDHPDHPGHPGHPGGPDPADDVSGDDAVAALLADLADDEPPARPAPAADPLRRRLLEIARARATDAALPEAGDLPAAARPYAAQVAALADLLAEPVAAQAVGVVHGWDAHDTVGHLLAVDALAAGTLGLPAPAATGTGTGVEERTAAVHALHAGAPLADVVRVWHAQAVALLRHAAARGDAGLGAPVEYLGLPLAASDVLLDRAFETWVHAEDLREALGRTGLAPDTAHVALLTDLGARLLPLTLDPAVAGPVLLDLTGPGGGRWLVASGGARRLAASSGTGDADDAIARLTLDAVEFCHVAGGRRAAGTARCTTDGDQAAGGALLAAAAALARL